MKHSCVTSRVNHCSRLAHIPSARCSRAPRQANNLKCSVQRSTDAGSMTLDREKMLKASLLANVGGQQGHDLSPEQRAVVEQQLKLLEEASNNPNPAGLQLSGTEWKLVYTTSKGNSSGKFGPFVGKVKQIFPANKAGGYINHVDVGFFSADLTGVYSVLRNDKIRVDFHDVTFHLGPFNFNKVFPEGTGGFWLLTYADEELRVLRTNAQGVFLLKRC